jgi:hypothetical protein
MLDSNSESLKSPKIPGAWYAGAIIICSDEKLILLQLPHNQQNDRVYFDFLRNIPREKLTGQR